MIMKNALSFVPTINLRRLQIPFLSLTLFAHCSTHKLYFGINFSKNYSLHTCTTGLLLYIRRKKYLSIFRNPLYYHNVSLPNSLHFTASETYYHSLRNFSCIRNETDGAMLFTFKTSCQPSDHSPVSQI